MYRAQLNKLAAEIKSKGLQRGKIYFQNDNAKLQELGWELLPHPPYSPNLAPSDYHLFRSLSNDLRDRKFIEENDLKMYLKDFFDSKSHEFYSSGIHKLTMRWQEVVNSKGAYIVSK